MDPPIGRLGAPEASAANARRLGWSGTGDQTTTEASRPEDYELSEIRGAGTVGARFVLCEAKTTRSCSVFELGHGEDPVERRPVLLMAELAAFHVKAFKHCGVEELAGAVVGLAVGVAAAGGERGGQLQDLLLLADVGVEVDQPVLGGIDRRANPGLLGLERRHVDGAAVVGIEQPASFPFSLGQLAGEQLALGAVGLLALGDLGGHLLSQSLGP